MLVLRKEIENVWRVCLGKLSQTMAMMISTALCILDRYDCEIQHLSGHSRNICIYRYETSAVLSRAIALNPDLNTFNFTKKSHFIP